MKYRNETEETLRRLKEVYAYDPETGKFSRKQMWRGRGEQGSVAYNGYLLHSLDAVHYLAHRMAWAYVHGVWPETAIEHLNGDKLDNRIANLRYKWGRRSGKKEELTQNRLKELVSYDSETGKFCWKVRTPKTKIGDEAGGATGNGYRSLSLDGQRYLAHRIAWLYVHGQWPEAVLDHINGDTADNRIANLRDVSTSQNVHNTPKLRSSNTTGYNGVTQKRNKFMARITVNNRIVHLGLFDTAEEAYTARLAAEEQFGLTRSKRTE